MTKTRKEIRDLIVDYIKDKEVTTFCDLNTTTAYNSYSIGGFDGKLRIRNEACHGLFGARLKVNSHKDHFVISGIFQRLSQYTIGGPQFNKDIIPYVEEGMFGSNSMFKDILHLITYIPDREKPEKTVIFYFNDTGKNLTPYERALVFSFFVHTRMYTENYNSVNTMLTLLQNGFTYQEAVIFSQGMGSVNSAKPSRQLPGYNTHGPFNGPSMSKCARFLFGLGPNKNAEYPKEGLYVNNPLWGMDNLPDVFFDGTGKPPPSRVSGVFSNYPVAVKDKFEYTPANSTDGLMKSLRSFIDNYKRIYVK